VMRFWVYQVRDDLDRSVDIVQEWAHGGGCRSRVTADASQSIRVRPGPAGGPKQEVRR
jgi:hypothetical protein